jgi:pimeloyl-ACP methyl ester carboxylesterase
MDEARFRPAEQRLWDSVGVAPSERRVHLARADVTVRIQEVGEGPTVLFVHGASNAGASWAPLIARLAGYHCVMLDRPGSGLSDPLPSPLFEVPELEAYADSLIPDVLDAIEVDRAHVVATSYGGWFALRAAAAAPARFDRIVELGWTIGAPIAQVPAVMRFASVPFVGWAMARIPPSAPAVRMTLRQIGLGQALDSGRFTPEMFDWFLALLRDTATLRNELRATPRVILPLGGLNEQVLLSDRLLASIEAPIRFLWGEDDPNGGGAVARRFVARIPTAELEVMPGVGHAPWIDDPDHAAAFTRRAFGD